MEKPQNSPVKTAQLFGLAYGNSTYVESTYVPCLRKLGLCPIYPNIVPAETQSAPNLPKRASTWFCLSEFSSSSCNQWTLLGSCLCNSLIFYFRRTSPWLSLNSSNSPTQKSYLYGSSLPLVGGSMCSFVEPTCHCTSKPTHHFLVAFTTCLTLHTIAHQSPKCSVLVLGSTLPNSSCHPSVSCLHAHSRYMRRTLLTRLTPSFSPACLMLAHLTCLVSLSLPLVRMSHAWLNVCSACLRRFLMWLGHTHGQLHQVVLCVSFGHLAFVWACPSCALTWLGPIFGFLTLPKIVSGHGRSLVVVPTQSLI